MARQSDKTGILKVTKPTSPTLAGEIRSTSEDTSGWSTDASGNKIDNGRLALSTSASTTITACETLYPDLWAKAPTGWRSGSNLVVPAQGGNMVGEWVAYTPSPTGFTASVINGFYRVVGDSIEIKCRAVISSVSGGMGVSIPSGFTEDSSKYPGSATNIFYGSASAYDTSANVMWTGNPYLDTGKINFYGPDGTSSIWDAADPFTWASGDVLSFEVTIPVTQLAETSTPYIQAYNNIAAGALGLPEATATQAGTVPSYEEFSDSLAVSGGIGTFDINLTRIGNLVVGRAKWDVTKTVSTGTISVANAIPASMRPTLDYTMLLYKVKTNAAHTSGTCYLRTTGTINLWYTNSTANFGIGDTQTSGADVNTGGDWVGFSYICDI